MQQMRLDSKEGIANGWAGIGGTGNLPDCVRTKSTNISADRDSAVESSVRRGWFGAAMRFVRNAAVGMLLISAVPVAVVGWKSEHLHYYNFPGTIGLLSDVNQLRSLAITPDASITPMQAGMAFYALQGSASNKEFPTRPTETPAVWPWRQNKDGKTLFDGHMRGFDGPSPQHIIEQSKKGFSPAQTEWLRRVAEAPVWKDFDLVAKAPAVDIIGGQFVLPFNPDAFSPNIPITKFAGTKELANVSMSRVAYYLSIGETARAEAALRSTISFGFALIDNATTTIDMLIGGVIVQIGRDGVQQFNAITGDKMPFSYTPRVKSASKANPRGDPVDATEFRRRLMADIANESLPRGLRIEKLSELSLSSCSSVPEMILGPNEASRTAMGSASKTLARYPSEQAYLDLVMDATNRLPESAVPRSPVQKVIVGAATVAATITNTPRLATCTRMAVVYR